MGPVGNVVVDIIIVILPTRIFDQSGLWIGPARQRDRDAPDQALEAAVDVHVETKPSPRLEGDEPVQGGPQGADGVDGVVAVTAIVQTASMFDPELTAHAERAATRLRARGETIAIAEGSCGGLISAALLSIPGASSYYTGGTVIYTLAASRAFISGAIPTPPGLRGATEGFALYLARSAVVKLEATWGIGEGGAAGPAGNAYGDPAGHAWAAVSGPSEATRHILTGSADRPANMVAFALEALDLLVEQLDGAPETGGTGG
jgi:nicotinamide-nucleotide amidase